MKSDVWEDPTVFRVWMALMLTASWREKTVEGVRVSPGDVVTNVEKLAKLVGANRFKVTRCLEKLVTYSKITIYVLGKKRVISVTDFDSYLSLTNLNCSIFDPFAQKTLDNCSESAHKNEQNKTSYSEIESNGYAPQTTFPVDESAHNLLNKCSENAPLLKEEDRYIGGEKISPPPAPPQKSKSETRSRKLDVGSAPTSEHPDLPTNLTEMFRAAGKGEFVTNVWLFEKEVQRLVEQYGELQVDWAIKRLYEWSISLDISSTTKLPGWHSYRLKRDHARCIRTQIERELERGKQWSDNGPRGPGFYYTRELA